MQLVWGRPDVLLRGSNASNVVIYGQAFAAVPGSRDAITHLADLDRSVFVMSFLERHSVHECSLLFGVPPAKRSLQAKAVQQIQFLGE